MKLIRRKKDDPLSERIDCQHRELFALTGLDRYSAIRKLPLRAPWNICSFYTHCNTCPLFLDGKGLTRSYCVDCASEREVKEALENGAEFLTLEVKNEENT